MTTETATPMSIPTDYHDLAQSALKKLATLHPPGTRLGEICGPISTGGHGSIELNLLDFKRAIRQLKEDMDMNMFDQIIYESEMVAIKNKRKELKMFECYDHEILKQFYEPIFLSPWIKTLYMLPKWRDSVGARWEHQRGIELKKEIKYLYWDDQNPNKLIVEDQERCKTESLEA